MGHSQNSNQKAWVGIALVLLGAYFLLRNFDFLPAFIPHYLFGWEMILIIIGASMASTGRREGFIFLGIGAFFLLPDVFDLPRFYIRDWWPLILIAAGISFVLRRRDHVLRQGVDSEDILDDVSIFGGSEKSITSQNFKGGKITAVFGGSEINFREAQLSTEGEVVLDIFCMFGGTTLVVPGDWTVKLDNTVIFGGFSEKRTLTNTPQDPKKILIIKGTVIFGGGEIKSI